MRSYFRFWSQRGLQREAEGLCRWCMCVCGGWTWCVDAAADEKWRSMCCFLFFYFLLPKTRLHFHFPSFSFSFPPACNLFTDAICVTIMQLLRGAALFFLRYYYCGRLAALFAGGKCHRGGYRSPVADRKPERWRGFGYPARWPSHFLSTFLPSFPPFLSPLPTLLPFSEMLTQTLPAFLHVSLPPLPAAGRQMRPYYMSATSHNAPRTKSCALVLGASSKDLRVSEKTASVGVEVDE